MQIITDEQAAHIHPLTMNGLHGRMLVIPPKKPSRKREILFLNGVHSTLERVYGIAASLSNYGRVVSPDFPGIGGMDSFYRIGEKVTLDNYADYLAAFVKMRYKRKKVTIVGFSFGFIVATRMLQRHPELVKNVNLMVSAAGFTHYEDLALKPMFKFLVMTLSRIGSRKWGSRIVRYVGFNTAVIRGVNWSRRNKNLKLLNNSPEKLKELINFEVHLWHVNDMRTWFALLKLIFTLNNCLETVDIPVEHIATDGEQWLDNYKVEQHMLIVFTKFRVHVAHLPVHAPVTIADESEAASFIPETVRRILAKQP